MSRAPQGAPEAPAVARRRDLLDAARPRDVLAGVAVVLLGLSAVLSGREAGHRLSPQAASDVGAMLDGLDMPRRLPDARLASSDGQETSLGAEVGVGVAIVTFYAAWCGPCQKELPELVQGRGSARLLVVTAADEPQDDIRRQLANIGLGTQRFLVDVDGDLYRVGRVKALPTTMLVTGGGRVLDRVQGYSPLQLHRLITRAGGFRE